MRTLVRALHEARKTVAALEAAIAEDNESRKRKRPVETRYTRPGRGPSREHGERDRAIVEAVGSEPVTLEEIAARYGMTRERVRQIAKANGVSREHKWVPARPKLGSRHRCPECRMLVSGSIRTHRIEAGHEAGKVHAADRERIKVLYERGYGYWAISRVVGVLPSVVKWHVVAMGLRPHRTGDYDRHRAPITELSA